MVVYKYIADDTLLFYQPNLEDLWNMKRVLQCFQIAFGLKINFQKSNLFGIGVNAEVLGSWATRIHYKVGAFIQDYYQGQTSFDENLETCGGQS